MLPLSRFEDSKLPEQPFSSYIVKLFGDCNLGCPYCYYFRGNPRVPRSTLNHELIEKLIDQSSRISNHVEFIWHGGEPLMAGTQIFRKILALQAEIHSQRGVRFRNLIQTNGTLINDEWIELFQTGSFKIGLSIDGPPWLHDKSRIYHSGKGSSQRVMQSVRLLQQGGIKFGVLSVLTRESLPHAKEIFDFFVSEGIERFDFLPFVEVDHAPSNVHDRELLGGSLLPNDFAGFMKTMFELWLKHDDADVSIRYLDNVIVGLLGGRPSNCTFNGTCGNYVTINHNGTVLPCDNFVGYKELEFGDIQESSLDDLLNGERRQGFRQAVSVKRAECQKCEFLSACGGGCNKYSFMWTKNFQHRNYFCGDRWEIFLYVSETLRKEHPGLELGRDTNGVGVFKEPKSSIIPLDEIKTLNSGLSVANITLPRPGISSEAFTLDTEDCRNAIKSLPLSQTGKGKSILKLILSKINAPEANYDWDDSGWSDSYSAWDQSL